MFQQCRLIGFFSHVKTLSETKEKVVSYLGVMARCSLKNFKKTDKNQHFFGRPLVLLQDSHRPHWTGVYANIQVISSLHVFLLKVQISI